MNEDLYARALKRLDAGRTTDMSFEEIDARDDLLRALLVKERAWDDFDPDAFEAADIAAKAILAEFVGGTE